MKPVGLFFSVVLVTSYAFGGETTPLPRPARESSTAYVLVPTIGEIARAEVGEKLYSEAATTVTKEYEGTVLAPVTAKLENYELDVIANSIRPMVAKLSDGRPMMCFPVKRTALRTIFGGRRYNGCLVDTKGDKTFDTATFEHQAGDFPLNAPVPYSVRTIEKTSTTQESFQVDVLYQGLSKGEVKISYREFLDGIARPAFTQDVTYELDSNGTAMIGFKGMRLRVLKATGQYIEYILEQPIPSFAKIRAETRPELNKQTGPKPWYQ